MPKAKNIDTPETQTKIKAILQERGIDQASFCAMIYMQLGVVFRFPEMNKIVHGHHKNYTVRKAAAMAHVLGVKIDDICEFDYSAKQKDPENEIQ